MPSSRKKKQDDSQTSRHKHKQQSYQEFFLGNAFRVDVVTLYLIQPFPQIIH
jgi:hypothetical protein